MLYLSHKLIAIEHNNPNKLNNGNIGVKDVDIINIWV